MAAAPGNPIGSAGRFSVMFKQFHTITTRHGKTARNLPSAIRFNGDAP